MLRHAATACMATAGVVAATAAAAAAWYRLASPSQKHAALSRVCGFESAAVFTHDGHGNVLAFSKPDKPDVLEFPAGKVELVDIQIGLLFWVYGLPKLRTAVALSTAMREYSEETGDGVMPLDLTYIAETGKNKTVTGQPVVWFALRVRASAQLGPRAEFNKVTTLKGIDATTHATFRKFDRVCLTAIQDDINRVVGVDTVTVPR